MARLADLFPNLWQQAATAATALRGAYRSEIYVIAVTAANKTFTVPAEWKGSIVRFHADGADVYYQIANAITGPAAVDITARSAESGSPIALSATNSGCMPIIAGTAQDVQFPDDAATFALISATTCALRAHLSES